MKGYKKCFLCLLMSIVCSMAWGQDKIVTNTGDVVIAYGVDITPNAIFYKKSQEANAGFERMDKSAVAMIIFADGRKMLIDGDTGNEQTAVSSTQQTANAVQQTANAWAEDNQRLIKQHNAFDLDYAKGDKGKKADVLLFAIGVSDDSQLCNEDIEISFSSNWYNSQDSYTFHNADTKANTSSDDIIVSIKNKTDKTIYIDLERILISRGNQTATFYDGTLVSETRSGVVSGGIGLGMIGVGASSSNTTNLTRQNSRLVTVPPHFSVNLPTQGLDNTLKMNTKGGYYSDFANLHVSMKQRFVHVNQNVSRGEIHHYTLKNTPFRIMLAVNYSFSEDCSQTKTLTSSLYPQAFVGMNCSVTTGWSTASCAVNRTDLTNPQSIRLVLTKMIERGNPQSKNRGFGALLNTTATTSVALPIY